MERMRFDSIVWAQNPSSLTVAHSRKWSEQETPFAPSCVQDLGRANLTIQGEGVFRGRSACRIFEALAERQLQGTVGALKLPGYPTMMAHLLKLELIGQSNPERIGYRFFFLEDQQEVVPPEKAFECGYCFASEGDTLWRIALDHDTTVEALAEKNPHIQWVNYLEAGERVVLG